LLIIGAQLNDFYDEEDDYLIMNKYSSYTNEAQIRTKVIQW
jgi:hypothetical protein